MVPSVSVEVFASKVHASCWQLSVIRAVGGWFDTGPELTSTAEYADPPPPAATAPVTPGTVTARVRFVVVPSPSWPYRLWPHVITEPSARTAIPWSRPEAIETAFATPSTETGRVRWVVVPSPSSSR
jgi:hypothetical protein